MSYIKSIIQEEHQRLKILYQKYIDIINALPKGTISIKKRNKKAYLYLAARQDGKLRFNYIGPANSEKAVKKIDLIKNRKDYELKLKQVKEDLKEIEKVIHGKKI